MSRTLVTGGTGFIGSALVSRLVRNGGKVRVFDNDFRGDIGNLKAIQNKIEWVRGDIRNPSAVRKAVHGAQTVYHLAFINGTQYFYEQPKLVMEVGLKGTLNVLDAVEQEKSVKNFIFASSSEVYQQPRKIPTPETIEALIPDVTNPRYSYGGSKLTGELLALHYLKRKGCRRIIFRPHNIYGPAMGWEHVVPQILKKIYKITDGFRANKAVIPIQGNGKETRAFCYIDDAVSGIVLSAQKGKDGEIYHVGVQEEVSIGELIRKIGNILNIQIKTKSGPSARGGTSRRCPDIRKLKALGYRPSIDLENGLRRTVHWFKSELRSA